MDLPDLPPDIRFRRLPQTNEALGFSFEAKRAALGPYVIEKWGWDEIYQMRVHAVYFRERPFYRIDLDGLGVGTVSLHREADTVAFNEFYLFPQFQGQGLGSRILAHCLSLADGSGLPVRLKHLKWNPAGRLYRRHGFEVVDETETHYLMEHKARKAG